MKTQILRLDAHDDIISTRDKMNWGQTGRILLVWPEHGRLLRRRVDLVLLQRHSNALGAQLALLTTDPVVWFHARQLAIPIFKNMRQAQSAHWRVERHLRVSQASKTLPHPRYAPEELDDLRQVAHPQTPAWMAQPIARIGFFTLGVLAVLAVAAVLLPGAQVSLTPQKKSQEITLTVRADPAQKNINLSGVIPAHPLKTIVEGRDLLEASGVTHVPDQAATGEVVFTNISDQPVKIPVGLVVRSLADPPVRFATLEAAELDAGPGITTTLPVHALTLGETGNRPPESLTAIEGSLGLNLAATNPAATQGGTDRTVSMPTASDRKRLYEKLVAALQKSALEEIQSQLPDGDLVFTPTLTITRVLEETYTPDENQPSGQLELNLRLEYQILSASMSDLKTLATVLLDANLPKGYTQMADSLTIQQVTPPRLESGSIALWRYSARRNLTASILPGQAVNLILGVPPDQAAKRLSAAWPLASAPAIRLTPSWWPMLPVLPFRISIDENISR